MTFPKSRRFVFCVGAIVAIAGSAQAGITDPALIVTASNANGTGVFQVFLSNGTFSTTNTLNDTWEWTSPSGGYDIFDDNFNLVSHVDFMQCKMIADPSVALNFEVDATSLDTHFAITTGILSFGAINPAFGRASAGMGAVDNDGDGVSVVGGFGGNVYHADYNSGSTFANLVGSFGTPNPFDSASNSGATAGHPAYLPMGGPIMDMSAQFDFTLSANDSANGTSLYEIIPSPGVGALAGMAGLLAAGRRRRS